MKLSTFLAALLAVAVCGLSTTSAQGLYTPIQTGPVQTLPPPTKPTPTKPVPTEPIPTTPAPTTPVPTTPAPTTPAPTTPAPTTPAPTKPQVCYIGCPPGQYCENGTNFCRPPQQANECFNPATGRYQIGCAPGFVCKNNKCSYA